MLSFRRLFHIPCYPLYERLVRLRLMKRNIISLNNLHWIFLSLFLLIITNLVLKIYLYSNGFISVSADEFSRGIRAAKWALHPSVNLYRDLNDIWLPLEKYLNGTALLIYPDVYWTPRITVIVASCIVIVAFYLIVYLVFENIYLSLIATIIVIFQPWFAWLSATPMLEMYYYSFLLSGLLFIILWLRRLSIKYMVIAGILFLISSGFHVQSWVFINVIILISIYYFYRFTSSQGKLKLFSPICLFLISNLFVILYLATELVNKGTIFGFLIGHTAYSKFVYGGYNVPFWEKLSHYPNLIIQNSFYPNWVFIFVACVTLWKKSNIKYHWMLFVFSLCSLVINSIMNVFSVPATAAPGRYSLYYLLLLSPYVAYGLFVFRTSLRRFIVILYLLFYTLWATAQIVEFPKGMSYESIATGRIIKSELDNSSLYDTTLNYMVELKYWEFLGVELLAENYNRRVYDREFDVYNRNTPSIFLQANDTICKILHENQIGLVALSDITIRNKADRLKCLRSIQEIGSWKVYQFVSMP